MRGSRDNLISLQTLVLGSAVALGCGDLEAEGEPSFDSGVGALVDARVGSHDGGEAGVAAAPVVVAKQVDTTSSEHWVYLDLESGETRALATAPDWPAWDLKLQRFKIAVNGGASSPGKVLVSVVAGSDFASFQRAPRDGYTADSADGSDTDLEPDYVISNGTTGWYDYNSSTHALSPRPVVYVLRTGEGAFYKLAVDGYYNAAGSSGYMQLRWATLAPPEGMIDTLAPGAADAGVDATTSASMM